MGDAHRNDGIHFNHTTIHGPVAAGENARAVQYVADAGGGTDQLRAQLERLRELIRANSAEISDVDNALRDVDDVETEATRDNADPDRLRDSLLRLARRVSAAGVVANSVYQIGDMVRQVLR